MEELEAVQVRAESMGRHRTTGADLAPARTFDRSGFQLRRKPVLLP
ncbi:hypothetical protein [Streptomyces sp. NPDC059604]